MCVCVCVSVFLLTVLKVFGFARLVIVNGICICLDWPGLSRLLAEEGHGHDYLNNLMQSRQTFFNPSTTMQCVCMCVHATLNDLIVRKVVYLLTLTQ